MSNLVATKKNQELLKIALKRDAESSNTKTGRDCRGAQNDSHVRLHAKRGGVHCGGRKKD